MVPTLPFFSTGVPFTDQAGVANCGYSGGYSTNAQSGGIGPLTNRWTLSPAVTLDSRNQGTYAGSANSSASYGSLGASASGTQTGFAANPALLSSLAAATFSDFITASSPLVASASNGWVQYQFAVSGSLSTPGTPVAFSFSDTYTSLEIKHNGGPSFGIMNATVRRGTSPTILNQSPPAGWTSSIGSLSGSSTFLSVMFPMTWGSAWNVEVGLLAWSLGSSSNDFLSTARMTGVNLFNTNLAPVTNFTLTSTSGTDYLRVGQPSPTSDVVPEPGSLALLASGLALLAYAAHAQRRRAD